MSAFEDFVNLELPRRPVLLTPEIAGYDGDPNDSGAPAIVKYAPRGSFYIQSAVDSPLWRKGGSAVATWTSDYGGTGNGADPVTFTASCPSDLAVGSIVRMNGDLIVASADCADASGVPAVGIVTSKPTSASAIVQCTGVAPTAFPVAPGTTYFVGRNGALSGALPATTTGTKLYLQLVGVAIGANLILLNNSFQVSEY